MSFFKSLTKYERTYYICALILTVTFAILFPEEDVNGHNGKIIMALMIAYTVLNVTCELQIAKQDKNNFIVSLFIEFSEIAIMLLLGARFATMATVVFFWIPVDIISYVNWRRYPDRYKKEITQVRGLSGKQEILVILGILAWTLVFGTIVCYVTEHIFVTDLFGGNRDLEVIVCYLDALVSALDIANGTFILMRFKEQWFAWYLEVIVDAIIWILSGQYVMLALTVCYLVNTTYGYVKWNNYTKIKNKV